MDKIEAVADIIAQSKKIVIFTGAGISTESGIPDFRSRLFALPLPNRIQKHDDAMALSLHAGGTVRFCVDKAAG